MRLIEGNTVLIEIFTLLKYWAALDDEIWLRLIICNQFCLS